MDNVLDSLESRMDSLEVAPDAKDLAKGKPPHLHAFRKKHWHSVGDITAATILTESDEEEEINPQDESGCAKTELVPTTKLPLRKNKSMALDILEELGTA